jgi:hypothetical protein
MNKSPVYETYEWFLVELKKMPKSPERDAEIKRVKKHLKTLLNP